MCAATHRPGFDLLSSKCKTHAFTSRLGNASFVPETREKPDLDYGELQIALEFVMKLYCQVSRLLLTLEVGALISYYVRTVSWGSAVFLLGAVSELPSTCI